MDTNCNILVLCERGVLRPTGQRYINIIQEIPAPRLPVVIKKCAIGFQLVSEASREGAFTAAISMLSTKGEVMLHQDLPVTFSTSVGWNHSFGGLFLIAQTWIKFPEFGRYCIRCEVDGKLIKESPLYVTRADA